MQTTYSATPVTARAKEKEMQIQHLSLEDLLPPGNKLVLNRQTRTLLLLAEGPCLLIEQQFSVNELYVLIPMLELFPHYCPYEVLLSHISGNAVTPASIDYYRRCLQEAQDRGTWQQELRPIRRALSSLRTKLHHFGLEVSNVRERGCSLTSLTQPALPG
jgi:hypothetical protein